MVIPLYHYHGNKSFIMSQIWGLLYYLFSVYHLLLEVWPRPASFTVQKILLELSPQSLHIGNYFWGIQSHSPQTAHWELFGGEPVTQYGRVQHPLQPRKYSWSRPSVTFLQGSWSSKDKLLLWLAHVKFWGKIHINRFGTRFYSL